MKLFEVLLRKELATQLFGGKKGKGKDAVGFVVSTAISLVFLTLFVYLFVAFQSKFVSLNLQGEVLVLFIAAAIAVQIIFAVPKAGQVLYGGADAKVILPLPISNLTMLAAKLAALWIKEFVNSVFFLVPVMIAYGVMSGETALYYLCVLFVTADASLFIVSVAALIAPLFVKIKGFILKRPVVILVISLVFLPILFYLYSGLLSVVSDMLLGNRMKFIFNKSVADVLRRIAACTLYADWLGAFLTSGNILTWLLALGVTAGIAVGAYFVSSHFYLSFVKAHAARGNGSSKERPNAVHTQTLALIYKELTEIFRNPAYLFSYLSVLLTLPFLCYLTIGILNELIDKLLGAEFILPFAVLITVMFSCVCNTFAGDVISREENRIMIMKTIPVPYKRQLACKVGIAIAIACVSDILSVLVLALTGTIDAPSASAVFFITFAATSASVMHLTAKDINDPVSVAGGENGNVSFAVVRGLLLSVLLGALCFFMQGMEVFYQYVGGGHKTITALYNITSALGGTNGSMIIALALCALDAVWAFFRMSRRLNERMRRIKI